MYSTHFEGRGLSGIFQKIPCIFVRASPWVPYQTNSELIKVEPLWRLPLTYLPSLEVATSDSVTCTKRSAPNKDHITRATIKHASLRKYIQSILSQGNNNAKRGLSNLNA